MAERIQRKREKGWRLPPGAKCVDRTSRWGNPYRIDRIGNMQEWTGWYVGEVGDEWANHGSYKTKAEAVARAVELYELHTGPMGNYELDVDEVRRELGGRDLACYCPLSSPCHADVLLAISNGWEIANPPLSRTGQNGEDAVSLFTTDKTQRRPSKHRPITQQYAIDQVTDIEQLRDLAHGLYEAFRAQKDQMNHLLGVHAIGDVECEPCIRAYNECDPAFACEGYKARHKLIMRGSGLI